MVVAACPPSAKADIASLMGSSTADCRFAIFALACRILMVKAASDYRHDMYPIRPLYEHFWLEAERAETPRRQWPGSPPKFVRREPQ